MAEGLFAANGKQTQPDTETNDRSELHFCARLFIFELPIRAPRYVTAYPGRSLTRLTQTPALCPHLPARSVVLSSTSQAMVVNYALEELLLELLPDAEVRRSLSGRRAHPCQGEPVEIAFTCHT